MMDLTQRAQETRAQIEVCEHYEDDVRVIESALRAAQEASQKEIRDLKDHVATLQELKEGYKADLQKTRLEITHYRYELTNLLNYLEDENRMGNLVHYMTYHFKRILGLP